RNISQSVVGVTPSREGLIACSAELAAEKFAPGAAHYDEAGVFPAEDFDDLFQAGLIAPAVPVEYGGLGLGPRREDVFALWMMTKELARADLSLARCWEGHVNSLVLLDGMATAPQKARWFDGVVNRGERWVAWSGEPQTRAPGERTQFGTITDMVPAG